MEIETNMQNPVPKAIWMALGVLAVVFLALAVADKIHNLSRIAFVKLQLMPIRYH